MNTETKIWQALCGILMIPVMVAAWGGAIMLLWNWFVSPLGVHPLTFWWAYGLTIMVSVFTYGSTKKKAEKDDELGELIIAGFKKMFGVWVMVGCAFLIHHWAVIG